MPTLNSLPPRFHFLFPSKNLLPHPDVSKPERRNLPVFQSKLNLMRAFLTLSFFLSSLPVPAQLHLRLSRPRSFSPLILTSPNLKSPQTSFQSSNLNLNLTPPYLIGGARSLFPSTAISSSPLHATATLTSCLLMHTGNGALLLPIASYKTLPLLSLDPEHASCRSRLLAPSFPSRQTLLLPVTVTRLPGLS